MRASRINVLADSPSEHEMILQDNVDVGAKFLKAELADIFAIDLNATTRGFKDSKKAQHHCALSATCPADDSNLFPRLNCKAKMF